jgi:hypothetical protein
VRIPEGYEGVVVGLSMLAVGLAIIAIVKLVVG